MPFLKMFNKKRNKDEQKNFISKNLDKAPKS